MRHPVTLSTILDETKQGFFTTVVREIYTDLSKVKHDGANLVKALKFAKRCHKEINFFKERNHQKKSFVKMEEEVRLRLLK